MEAPPIVIRPAVKEQDHKALVALAKKSPYISAFSSMMFSSDAAYEKGWIRVAERHYHHIELLGFTCVRHKVRAPETMLYFIMVGPSAEGQGVGKKLMYDLEDQTPHNRIALKVEKKNDRAIFFYSELGYQTESTEAYDGKGLLMAKENFK